MEPRRLDGNAAAGALSQLVATEMTAALGTCAGCGSVEAVGAVHAYFSAGVVLRCPHCDGVLVRIVESRSRVWVDFRGLRSLELRI